MNPRVFAAVDLGASSGRVIAGVVANGGVTLETVHRFPNGARRIDGHLRWPIDELFEQVLQGLRRLARTYPQVESIGIDTWGVDYALLSEDGRELGEPISYRDDRTAAAVDRVHRRITPAELFDANGLQFLPFTTLYQLEAEREGPRWHDMAHIALLPDLLAFRLTGRLRAERTNASTTGLLDVRTGEWSARVLAALDITPTLLPPLESPGEVRGPVTNSLRNEVGLPTGIVVTTVGSHDTASAVAGIPAAHERFAYVSSGTWSLVGLELDTPVLTAAAQRDNFTNERGVEGTVRFLRNTGGLWLLQEARREWAAAGYHVGLEDLMAQAAGLPANAAMIDVNDPVFLSPGPMVGRIAAAAGTTAAPPRTPAEVVRCVVDSLARAYADAAGRAAVLTGTSLEVIHLVGGGSQGQLLCQATANWSGLPVVAGPAEATALGNVLVQARAHGALSGSLSEARAAAARTMELGRYEAQ